MQPKEVADVVEAYLEEANRLGFKALRIVHGRGIGVQREIVRAVLARTPFVIAFNDAPPEAGGGCHRGEVEVAGCPAPTENRDPCAR